MFDRNVHFPVKWLITIVDRGRGEEAARILSSIHKTGHLISLGTGTASSEVMDYLGLDEPEKDLVMTLVPQPLAKRLLRVLAEQMALAIPGKGIAFTLSLGSVSAAASKLAEQGYLENTPNHKEETVMPDKNAFSLVASIVPHGQSDLVVEATRAAGARGGTMIRARSADSAEASRFFHITIQPEKEVVFTIVPTETKKAVMQAICSRILEETGEHGVVLSLPVEDAVGLRLPAADKPDEE